MIEHSANQGTRFWWGAPRAWPVWAVVAAVPFLGACGGASTPPPTPVVLVVTATPPPATSGGPTASPPAARATAGAITNAAVGSTPARTGATQPAGTPAAQMARAAATPTSAPAEQRLDVNRTNSYRGLEFIVEEVREGATIESERAGRGKTLVGVRLRLHNPTGQVINLRGGALTDRIRLQLPTGGNPRAESKGSLHRVSIQPGEVQTGWVYFELDQPMPLEPLRLVLGGGDETPVQIAFTGPEEKVAVRTFEYLRSTDEFRGLLWSLSGGTIRLDLPDQQANPGQEFIILKVRATNPSPAEVRLRDAHQVPQRARDYLRLEADNGVLLQLSAELNALPTDFPPRAEQDALYAWQLPQGSRNPTLVILSPAGSEARVPVGPLPLP
jgi:hypothetical protein